MLSQNNPGFIDVNRTVSFGKWYFWVKLIVHIYLESTYIMRANFWLIINQPISAPSRLVRPLEKLISLITKGVRYYTYVSTLWHFYNLGLRLLVYYFCNLRIVIIVHILRSLDAQINLLLCEKRKRKIV